MSSKATLPEIGLSDLLPRLKDQGYDSDRVARRHAAAMGDRRIILGGFLPFDRLMLHLMVTIQRAAGSQKLNLLLVSRY